MKLSVCALAAILPAAPLAAQCPPPATLAGLDSTLFESSGLTAARRPGVFWTLVDSDGDSAVFAVDTSGALVQRVRVRGATNRDWEDVAGGACPNGGGRCLWIADMGDNLEVHPELRLYVIPEPAAGDTVSAPARLYRARYQQGPRDTEALFVTPEGQPYVVTKGRNGHRVRLYLFPLEDGVATMVPLQLLSREVSLIHEVSGAAASPDGRLVALRTYAAFTLYRTHGSGEGLRLEAIRGTRTPFRQPQGESVAFSGDALYFTSEVPPGQHSPLARTVCRVPGTTR